MNSDDILSILTKSQWQGDDSSKYEVYYLHIIDDQVITSRMVHKEHHTRIGDGTCDHPWQDHGSLPHYFDQAVLERGLQEIADGNTSACRVPFTHMAGNTDGGFIHHKLKDEFFEIARLESGQYEIRLISGGRITETYKPSD